MVIAFTLFGVLQGLNGAINKAVAASHADRLVCGQPPALWYCVAHRHHASTVQTTPGVIASTYRYYLGATRQKPEHPVPIIATDLSTYLPINPELKVNPTADHGIQQQQDGHIVGVETARKYHRQIGRRIVLQSLPKKDGSPDWPFDIIGTYVYSEEQKSSVLLIANYH